MASLRRNGRHDPHVLKAVFLAGGPGSGKSHTARALFGWRPQGATAYSGLKRVDSDQLFEQLLHREGIDPRKLHTLAPAEYIAITEGPDALRTRAKVLTAARAARWQEGRLGLVIDGTGGSVEHIRAQVEHLRALGYDCMMVFVNTPLATALDRNARRERRLPDALVTDLWHRVQDNLGALQQVFGQDNFVLVDGRGDDAARTARQVAAFLRTPVQNRVGRAWLLGTSTRANPMKTAEDAAAIGWSINVWRRRAPSTKQRAIILHLVNANGRIVGQLFALQGKLATSPYEMVSVDAPDGWGPLLYTVAMELAGNAGLVADRSSVSAAATRIWQRFYTSSQVVIAPLPPKMTRWDDPAMDHVYFKAASTVRTLQRTGHLRARRGDPPRREP